MTGRNERFVRAAKRLLLFQVAAGVGAAAVAGWAAFAVIDLARERDALAIRVAQLEAVVPPGLLPPPIEDGSEAEPAPAVDGDRPGSSPLANTTASGGGSSSGGGNEIRIEDPPPPRRVPCRLYPGGGSSECFDPPQRVNDDICLDVAGRQAFCPGLGPTGGGDTGTSGGTGQGNEQSGGGETPPPPERNCRSVERRPIVCVPPFRRTPVPGVCLDGNNRPMRCPPGTPRQTDEPRPTDQQQQPTPLSRGR